MDLEEVSTTSNDRDFFNLIILFLTALQTYLQHQSKCLSDLKLIQRFNVSKMNFSYYTIIRSRLGAGILNLNDRLIRKHLRVSAVQFQQIENMLPFFRQWPRRIELMIFLHWLASGASYRVTGASFNISRSITKVIVHNILSEMIKFVPNIINYPDLQSLQTIGDGFCKRAKTSIFKNAVGVIDSCHIIIKRPHKLPDQYKNRKSKYSIQLQAVCDHTGKFINIFVGYPGSVYDQHVLINSPLYLNRTFPPPGKYLLGDNGYKCCVHPIAIVTPVKETRKLTKREKNFNTIHCNARNIIDYSFGIMKSRWKSIFKKDLKLKTSDCVRTIAALCVIHNICMMNNSADEIFELEDTESFDNEYSPRGDEEGINLRNILINAL